MKRRLGHVCVLLLALCPIRSAAAAGLSLSLDEYRQQLRALSEKIDSLRDHPEQARAVESDLPDTLIVNTGSGEITVNYHDLKSDLAVFSRADAHRREALASQLQKYVRALQSQTEAYIADGRDSAAARKQLESILARREFRNVNSSPSLINILLAKILGWIVRMFEHLPFGSSRFNWFQIFIYGFVGAALAVLLYWTVRRLRSRPADSVEREIIPFAPSARSWRAWLAEARALAQREDWRGAIHLGYWAGISFLEEHGSWRPNRARTPREYLRLLTSRNPSYPALSSLTRKFEVVWYGNREAQEADFQETLGHLEKLGCR